MKTHFAILSFLLLVSCSAREENHPISIEAGSFVNNVYTNNALQLKVPVPERWDTLNPQTSNAESASYLGIEEGEELDAFLAESGLIFQPLLFLVKETSDYHAAGVPYLKLFATNMVKQLNHEDEEAFLEDFRKNLRSNTEFRFLTEEKYNIYKRHIGSRRFYVFEYEVPLLKVGVEHLISSKDGLDIMIELTYANEIDKASLYTILDEIEL